MILASLSWAQGGDARAARKAAQEAIPKLSGQDLGKALEVVRDSSFSLGDYEAAGSAARRAVGLLDLEHDAENWGAVGRAAVYLGKYAEAIQSYEKALAIDRKRGDVEGEVVRLNNLGSVYFEQGNYLEAYRTYNDALARVEASKDAPWYGKRRQIAISNLATLYQRLGRYEHALDLYQAIQGDSGVSASERAQMLANQGTLYRRLEDPVKALETYRTAQVLFAKERHPFGEVGVLKNIGIVLGLDLQRVPEALEAFSEAKKVAATGAQAVPTRLYFAEALRQLGRDDEARREFAGALKGARAMGSQEYGWRATFGLGQLEEKAGHAETAMRLYRESITGIESLRSGLELVVLKRDFLADKRQVYDAAIGLAVNSGSPAELFALMEKSRARVLQDKTAGMSLQEVQVRLPADTLLLEYWAGGAVLAVTRDSARVSRFGSVDVRALRAAILSGSAEWRGLFREAGRTLLPSLGSSRNVVIVPDGPLGLIPFEALIPGGSESLLIEKAAVTYMPSASLLGRSSDTHRGWAPPWKEQVLALADPAGGGDEGGLFRSEGAWGRLPSAVVEAQNVARLLPGRGEVRIGKDATKDSLLAGVTRGVPVLHVATHATADMADPERSRILLSSGFLFLREVYGLDLKGQDLVVLSACDTETGKLVRGEGVEGFGKAFLTAGAKAAVTTLWKVQDRSTAELMGEFYSRLASGSMSKAEALRGAKLAMVARSRPPADWAAFVLNGDGLSPLAPRVVRWWWLGLAAALCTAAGVWAYTARRT